MGCVCRRVVRKREKAFAVRLIEFSSGRDEMGVMCSSRIWDFDFGLLGKVFSFAGGKKGLCDGVDVSVLG